MEQRMHPEALPVPRRERSDANRLLRSRLMVSLACLLPMIPAVGILTSGLPGNSLSFTLLQALASAFSLMISLMALLRYYSRKDFLYLVLGAGFLGVFLLESFQLLAGAYWFLLDLPMTNDRLLPWDWIVTQTFLACMLLGSFLFRKRFPHGHEDLSLHERRVYLLTGVFVLSALAVFNFVDLPHLRLPWMHLPQPGNLPSALVYALSLGYLLRNGGWRKDLMDFSLLIVIGLLFVTQGFLVPWSLTLFDQAFLAGHLLKLCAYIVLLVALLLAMYTSFRALEAAHGSRQRLLAELEEKNDQLHRSNRELESFAYTASHDLQEPLRKIQAFGSYLERSREILPQKEQDYLSRMISASERMSDLISHLLSYSRINTTHFHPRLVDLGLLVENIHRDLLEDAGDPEARIEWQDLPVVDADPVLLEQVLRNLLSNALKYRRADRSPRILLSANPARTRMGEAAIELRVADNGIGIEKQYREAVFGVFRRLHGRNEYSGTGIGLAIVQRIVSRHGGEIRIEGNEWQGSTFVLLLPLSQKGSAPAET